MRAVTIAVLAMGFPASDSERLVVDFDRINSIAKQTGNAINHAIAVGSGPNREAIKSDGTRIESVMS